MIYAERLKLNGKPKKKPNVRVTFAGKGSRLFQWLKVINKNAANQYYGNMFVMGFGRESLMESLAGWQLIELPKLNDPDIKYMKFLKV